MSSENTQPNDPNFTSAKTDSESNTDAPVSGAEGRVAELEAALKEEKNKYLYLYADFDNYKKRAVKERSEAMKYGWENVARDLLAVVDNLERAVEHIPGTVDANLKAGIEMTVSQFRNTLEKQGVALIPSGGTPFNPELHEAMGQEPSDLPSGTVTQTLVKGYTLHGRLLRPAKVVMSSGTPVAH
ncbi:MAG: nucleotide exchange factor GrpE [Cryobacterium sp.]|nr:nucleotide exchange factor GrpE [Oligoflexia bacterium]